MNDASVLAFAEGHFRAVIERRAEDIVSGYAEDAETWVFLEGPRPATLGHERIAAGWRAFVDAPFEVRDIRVVDGPRSRVEGTMAWYAARVELDVVVDGREKTVAMRGTFVMRRGEADGRWRIEHEHFSLPAPDPYGTGDWVGAQAGGQR
jgi:ketosteroid isomerase-like protein